MFRIRDFFSSAIIIFVLPAKFAKIKTSRILPDLQYLQTCNRPLTCDLGGRQMCIHRSQLYKKKIASEYQTML